LDVLDYYSLEGINMWGWIGIEACFTVGEGCCNPACHQCRRLHAGCMQGLTLARPCSR
jgi:hypothetical protein